MHKELHVRIRERRKELGLNQGELGARLDPPVTQPAISAWEKGRETVPDDRLEGIAAALETTVDDLLGDVRYVRTHEEVKDLWRDTLLNDMSIDEDAQIVLLWMSTLVEVSEVGVATYTGSLDRVAGATRALSRDEVEAAWPLVLDSPYVERYSDAEWVLHLTVPRLR